MLSIWRPSSASRRLQLLQQPCIVSGSRYSGQATMVSSITFLFPSRMSQYFQYYLFMLLLVCFFDGYVVGALGLSAIWLMATISVEQWLVISTPFKYARVTLSQKLLAVSAVYTGAAIATVPPLFANDSPTNLWCCRYTYCTKELRASLESSSNLNSYDSA